MENPFTHFFKPYLDYIDRGDFFKRPFSILYMMLGVLNLLIPISMLVLAIRNDVFTMPFKFGVAFILVWLVISFASWLGFQIWWHRKEQVLHSSESNDEFIALPVFSHFLQTLGEWLGSWLGLTGFGLSLVGILVLGRDVNYLAGSIGLDVLRIGSVSILLFPVYGFLIIVIARFLAEQFRALAAIANNTKR